MKDYLPLSGGYLIPVSLAALITFEKGDAFLIITGQTRSQGEPRRTGDKLRQK